MIGSTLNKRYFLGVSGPTFLFCTWTEPEFEGSYESWDSEPRDVTFVFYARRDAWQKTIDEPYDFLTDEDEERLEIGRAHV